MSILQDYITDIENIVTLNEGLEYRNYVFNVSVSNSASVQELASFNFPKNVIIQNIAIYNQGSININNFTMIIGNTFIGFPTNANNNSADSVNTEPMIVYATNSYSVTYHYPFYPIVKSQELCRLNGVLASSGSVVLQVSISCIVLNF